MRILSYPTAFWGLPSMAVLGLGISLLVNQPNVEKNYQDYIKKTSIAYPFIQEIDSLDNCGNNLQSAGRELTSYVSSLPSNKNIPNLPGNARFAMVFVPHHVTTTHNPDVDKSLKYLDFARENISKIKFAKIKGLDNQIETVQNELKLTKKGKSQKFYEPQRQKIYNAEKMAREEMGRLENMTSTKIVDERRTLKNSKDNKNYLGMILTALGGVSTLMWGVWRILNRDEIEWGGF
jgi:hypothetical protein